MHPVIAIPRIREETDQIDARKPALPSYFVDDGPDAFLQYFEREAAESAAHYAEHPDGRDEDNARLRRQLAVRRDEAFVVEAEGRDIPVPRRGVIGAKHQQHNIRIPGPAFAVGQRLHIGQVRIAADGRTVAAEVANFIVRTQQLLQQRRIAQPPGIGQRKAPREAVTDAGDAFGHITSGGTRMSLWSLIRKDVRHPYWQAGPCRHRPTM